MQLITINRQPTRRQLRQFGLVSLFAWPLFGWLCGAGTLVMVGLMMAGAVLATTGFLRPLWIRPLFVALSIASAPLAIVLGELALLLIYVGLLLPVAVVFRLCRRDGLERRMDREAATYWQPKEQPGGPASYYRQS